jgi:hypothetical protein
MTTRARGVIESPSRSTMTHRAEMSRVRDIAGVREFWAISAGSTLIAMAAVAHIA